EWRRKLPLDRRRLWENNAGIRLGRTGTVNGIALSRRSGRQSATVGAALANDHEADEGRAEILLPTACRALQTNHVCCLHGLRARRRRTPEEMLAQQELHGGAMDPPGPGNRPCIFDCVRVTSYLYTSNPHARLE